MKALISTLAVLALSGSGAIASLETLQYRMSVGGSKIDSLPVELLSGVPKIPNSTARGRRSYEPLVFRKRIDKSTPILKMKLDNRTKISSGKLEEYRKGSDGKWIFSRRCLMRGLRVSRILTSDDKKFETITCTFEEITIDNL